MFRSCQNLHHQMHVTVCRLKCTSANHLVLQWQQAAEPFGCHISGWLILICWPKHRQYEKICPQYRTAETLVPCGNKRYINTGLWFLQFRIFESRLKSCDPAGFHLGSQRYQWNVFSAWRSESVAGLQPLRTGFEQCCCMDSSPFTPPPQPLKVLHCPIASQIICLCADGAKLNETVNALLALCFFLPSSWRLMYSTVQIFWLYLRGEKNGYWSGPAVWKSTPEGPWAMWTLSEDTKGWSGDDVLFVPSEMTSNLMG